MKIHKIYTLLSGLALLGMTACGDYLDKVPDDRASVDTQEKVAQFLVSAYPDHLPCYIFWFASDDVTDNGTQYNYQANEDKIYRFQDDTYTGNDDPYSLWNQGYICIATANNAIQSINELGGSSAMPGEYAEALLCRAYDMYTLAQIFCMSWNPDSADVYLGLPYPLQPEAPTVQYERGTLRELYAHINDDIEEALPLVSDTHLSTPKYHFNRNAAYAFAARFNLFYGNYAKAIEYANQVLGSNPASMLRDWSSLLSLSNYEDILNAYLNSGVNANLMLQTAYSSAGRALTYSRYRRYGHNRDIITYESIWPAMPWNPSAGMRYNTLYMSHMCYGTDQAIWVPKQLEKFETTDKINNTGYAHIVSTPFTADETLLVRAEAEALSNDFTSAIRDINYWMQSHCATSYSSNPSRYTPFVRPTALTETSINEFYDALDYEPVDVSGELQRSVKKKLHPQGFTVASGTQENIIQLILQCRRIDTFEDGSRFLDLKRYGIEYQHAIDGEPAVTIHAGDKRMAFQLPDDAISNGLTANPR